MFRDERMAIGDLRQQRLGQIEMIGLVIVVILTAIVIYFIKRNY